MIIYFTEEDLVSFGEYMVSPQRRQLFRDRPNPEGLSLDERLSMVHDADLSNWAYLMSHQVKATNVVSEPENELETIN